MIQTDPRFEQFISALTPLFGDEIVPGRDGKEDILKRTFVIRSLVARVQFPEGASFSYFAATAAIPEYFHAKVGGAHVHLLDGTMPAEEYECVTVEMRIRTAEPAKERKGARRNYELIVRLSPAPAGARPNGRVVVRPHANADVTLMDPYGGDEQTRVEAYIHKGGNLRIFPIR